MLSIDKLSLLKFSLFTSSLIFFQINGSSLIQDIDYVNISISNEKSFLNLCQLAVYDPLIFKNFRSQIAYKTIVETLGEGDGIIFDEEIAIKYPHLLKHLPKICLEDKIGGPLSYTFTNTGNLSPATLRYIKIAGDLEKYFGDISEFDIIEVGGGYGGQCKIINDLYGFNNYNIIDLAEVTPLINKYLSYFNVQNFTTTNSNYLKKKVEKYDLFISNYALSEIHRLGQFDYINIIINSALHGYIIYNHMPHINALPIADFINLLKLNNKNIRLIHEAQNTVGDIIIWHPNT